MNTVPLSNGEDASPLAEFNKCHTPGGTPAGGQFCSTTGGVKTPQTSKGRRLSRGAHHTPARQGPAGFAQHTDLGAEIRRMADEHVPMSRMFAHAKRRVLARAETPEEREHAGFIARLEVETALSLRRGGGDSKTEHTTFDPVLGGRVYTDARVALHNRILAMPDINNPNAKSVPMGQQPVAVFLGGLPASGKTTAVGDLEKGPLGQNAVIISNDAIKTKLPGYRGHNAHEMHEESSDLAERLFHTTVAERKNLIYDFTFKSEESMEVRMRRLKEAGYRIEVRFVDTDVNTSVASALHRATKEERAFKAGTRPFGGRYIPLDHIRRSLRVVNGQRTSQNRQTFERLKKYYDAYQLVDNNGLLNHLRKTGKDSKARPIERVGRLSEGSAWWRRGRPGVTIFPD